MAAYGPYGYGQGGYGFGNGYLGSLYGGAPGTMNTNAPYLGGGLASPPLQAIFPGGGGLATGGQPGLATGGRPGLATGPGFPTGGGGGFGATPKGQFLSQLFGNYLGQRQGGGQGRMGGGAPSRGRAQPPIAMQRPQRPIAFPPRQGGLVGQQPGGRATPPIITQRGPGLASGLPGLPPRRGTISGGGGAPVT
jgi:hypothetical protein